MQERPQPVELIAPTRMKPVTRVPILRPDPVPVVPVEEDRQRGVREYPRNALYALPTKAQREILADKYKLVDLESMPQHKTAASILVHQILKLLPS